MNDTQNVLIECKQCHQKKPIDGFYVYGGKVKGMCRACQYENKKARLARNKVEVSGLTRKQKVFVGELVANPTMSGTAAAMVAYDAKNKNVAHNIASENLRKPAVLAHLNSKAERAENAVTTIMDYSLKNGRKSAAYAGIGLSAANSLLDRVHGKATQRIESTSTTVAISIDLSGDDGESG